MSPAPRFHYRGLAVAALLVSATSASGCANLDSFFFSPTPVDQEYDLTACPEDVDGWPAVGDILPPDAVETIPVRVDGDAGSRDIDVRFVARAGATVTVLYSHGKNDNICHYWGRVVRLWELGFHVMIYDYAGFGLSEGEPTETAIYEDVRGAHAALIARSDVDPGRIVYYGYSLGGAPTIDLAAELPPAALITEATFTGGDDFASDFFGVGLSGSFFLREEWDSIGKLAAIEAPYLILHGTEDATVLVHHGEELFDAANEPKRLFIVEGADHGEVPTLDPAAYDDEVTGFIAEHVE